MLVISRKKGESLLIGDDIEITVEKKRIIVDLINFDIEDVINTLNYDKLQKPFSLVIEQGNEERVARRSLSFNITFYECSTEDRPHRAYKLVRRHEESAGAADGLRQGRARCRGVDQLSWRAHRLARASRLAQLSAGVHEREGC